ncbi:PQQ-binding-like beta-propeller repeat protein [Agromyces larvae]|uniref:PQQ-binding-like beta-propeller repeat protein n=1 Tax=Agromyces larvae TaxID=2929802 RepID=A0ABY4BYZ5_9MICO|nr:PQQ-binding-like beta-propeller repeat protein [Agromyces larvae]UOE44407.1 PQQ-binding-like beta-propeller repeat protein [Agromyces larvae]
MGAIGIGLGLTGAEWGPWPGAAVGAARADDTAPLRFAVFTDTHANLEETAMLANLTRVFAAVEAENPDFVLHCGDITDAGRESDFETYRSLIPAPLWDRIRHVPGNHEIRWDITARERYQRWFGPTSYSFDAGGVHFVALDPTQALQEPGLFSDDLAWIRDDLAAAGDTPSIMFLHYPLGDRNFFVNDADEFLRTIDPFPVRGIFAGHIHRNEVDRFNGLTQVAAVTSRQDPFYLRVTERRDASGRAFVVELITLGATDADPVAIDLLAEIPLDSATGEGIGELRPKVRSNRDVVDVTAGRARAAVRAEAQVYPQGVFGAANAGDWTPLGTRGGSWHGELDAAALAAGVHRVQVRAFDESGSFRYETATFERKSGHTSPGPWEVEIGGQLQGALAAAGDTVVAVSTSGTVAAVRIGHGRKPRTSWTAQLGPIHRGAAFSTDARTVYVPSADHTLTALGADDGRRRWRTDLARPVMSTPAVFDIGGEDRIVVAAGDRLHCLDAAGGTVWTSEVPGMAAGRATSDGFRVFMGGGDGRGHAYDLATGAHLWSILTNDRVDTYRQLIYGPWDDWTQVLPTGAVLFSTVTDAIATDPATGAELWRLAGGYLLAPGRVLDESNLLLATEWGVVELVDPATGAKRWSSQAVPRLVNTGPVPHAKSASVWLVGAGGLVVSVDAASGAVTSERQLFTANTFSQPVIVGDTFVVGAQDGVLRGIRI